MAKLRISKVEESGRGDIGWGYEVEIDGAIRKDVIALDLHYDTKSFITADVTLLIDDLDVSAELNAIEALNTAKRMKVLFNLEKSQ